MPLEESWNGTTHGFELNAARPPDLPPGVPDF
jgi:hypothetical protein